MARELTATVLTNAVVTCDQCQVATKCLFHLPRLAARAKITKGPGQRSKHVAYVLVTDRAENHSAKKDFMSCQKFVETMQDRMRFGASQREQGRDGEIIGIIGGEGDEIEQGFEVALNSRGEVINVQPWLVEPLKKAGEKVNVDDRTLAAAFKRVKVKIKVPRLEANPMGGTAYSNEVIAEARALEESISAAEALAIEAAMAQVEEGPKK